MTDHPTFVTTLLDPQAVKRAGTGVLPSLYPVTELATASLATMGEELIGFMRACNLCDGAMKVIVDQRLASLWFGKSFHPYGWESSPLWDPIAGDYQTRDGWIRLHTNLPHHRAAALSVLKCAGDKEAVAVAVAQHAADELEQAIVSANGVAAAMRSPQEWAQHPQGSAVAQEPLIAWTEARSIALAPLSSATPARPLEGLRVLDLTRVLAGPVSTRSLAGLGADVLRIDPLGWDEPGVLPEIALGKRMAQLDLKTDAGLNQLVSLMQRADVLVHGYRPGALDALGLSLAQRLAIAPNLIEVSLNAYGWSGPWSGRRGFDSLVQMSAGIAEAGRAWAGATRPTPLPVQALDHATGYLMAAAVLSALTNAVRTGMTANAQLSLARTAHELTKLTAAYTGPEITTATPDDMHSALEKSSWGPAHRLRSPLTLGNMQLEWSRPASASGTHLPEWD